MVLSLSLEDPTPTCTQYRDRDSSIDHVSVKLLIYEKTFCPELAEKGLFTPPIRSCHVIYSMRIWYTISHRIVAQIKPKSLNTICSEALTWRNSTSTNASSPLTNGAPCRRWSRGGVVLRCPRNIFRC